MPGREKVLVISKEKFTEVYDFQGFSPSVAPFSSIISDLSNLKFIARKDAENDPSYKQIIPYGILRYLNTYLSYQREKSGSEKRLFNLRSIGIGGHINSQDANNISTLLQNALLREIREEILISDKILKPTMIGLINDDSNDVGKVHLGVVYFVDLLSNRVQPLDKAIGDCIFYNITELLNHYEKYESWSKICIDYLNGGFKN